MPKTPDHVLRLIEQAAAECATFIDLGNCGLTHFPPELVELQAHLEGISFGPWYYDEEGKYQKSKNEQQANQFLAKYNSWNKFSELHNCSRISISDCLHNANLALLIPHIQQVKTLEVPFNQIGEQGASKIAKLKNLTSLNISSNQIGVQGATEIAKLKNLTSLNISSNHVGEQGATEIAKLKNLTELHINNNQIGVHGATEIAKLKNLTSLYIYSNHIGDQGATEIAKLKNLTELDISSNQIELSDFFKTLLENAQSLRYLYTWSNPWKGIPNELTSRISALRSWFQELRNDPTPLYTTDYKLLLCGNSGVGKSTILDRLLGKDFDRNKTSTHGIRIEQITLDDRDTTAWVWDFGGQEIYHSTHRLFLKGDAIALVVWDQKTEEQTILENRLRQGDHFFNRKLPYWLHTLKRNGSENQIVLVQNKLDEEGHQFQAQPLPNWPQLQNTGFSAATQDNFEIKVLRRKLLEAAKLMRNWKMQVPRSWSGVRQEVLEAAKEGATKKWAREYFEERCAFHKVADNTVSSLLNYLHDSGVLFRDNKLFPNEIIINQQWALDAIYTTLNPQQEFYKRLEKTGTFTRAEIFAEWEKLGHALNDRKLFLNIMVSAHLCFQVNAQQEQPIEEQVFLHPALLRKQAHNMIYRFWDKIATNQIHFLRYQHKHLDFYTIQRFITELGQKTELESIWRNGLYINWANSDALVQADIPKGTILVKTHGPEAGYLMDGIRNQFRNIHEQRPVEVQVSTDGIHFVSIEEIEKQRKLPDAKSVLATDDHTAVPLEPLLWVLQRDEKADLNQKLPDIKQEPTMAQAKRAGTRIFISYAKENKLLVDAFVDLLSTYERDKKIQIYYDKEIHHRSGWDEQLQAEMREAEAFVVFASTDYFAKRKQYIFDEEIPLMKQRHQQEGIPIFPILVNRPALVPYRGSILQSISLLGKDLCLGDDDDAQCLNKSMEAAQSILEQLGIS